ncbi:MAG: DNA polymerase III subunit delta [Candidatus Gastranaerophilales bacterium]|nr:DNA polymerase III subunit delta [Candidatus Gastranaerophilales bacterium]
MSIYFFYGDEDYNIELEIKKLKDKLLDKNFASMNFKTADNPSFPDLISLLRTQPMMFGNQMIVINCEEYFSKSFEDNQLEQISQALEDNAESLCIVFAAILPRNEGKKVDSRKKIYKIITKYAQSHEFPTFKTYKTEDIANWINKEAKKHEITFEKDAVLTLIEQVGNNLRELAKEVEKLKLLAHPENKITKKMVKEICISNEDLFAFADYLLKGEKCSALLEFKKLLDKKHPLEVLSTLQTMLRKWITMKLKSSEMSAFEISKLVGQHEFVVKTTLEKMKNTQVKDLVRIKQNLTEAEYKIKSGQSVNIIDEVETALLI